MSDQVTTSLAQAKVLVMEGMAGKAPRVNTTNYPWEIWSNGTQSWVDTGISAVNGAPGADGADCVSPVITVSSITGGHRLTITDAEHPSGQTVDVMNGEDYVLTNADKQEIADLLDDDVPTLVTDWLDRRQTEHVVYTITPDDGYTISGISTGQGDNDLTYNNGAVVKNGNTVTIKPNLVVGDVWINVTTAAS